MRIKIITSLAAGALLLLAYLIRQNNRINNILVEEHIQPKVISFLEEHGDPFKEKHTLAFLEAELNLDYSYEPVDRGTTRKILFGIHYSDLYPKNKTALECPHYQEKIFVLNGFSSLEAEDRYVFSSFEQNSFFVANLSYYTFNARDKKVKLKLVQSFRPTQEKELNYSDDLAPDNIHAIRLHNDVYSLFVVTATYNSEALIRHELVAISTIAGFMQWQGRSYFLQGYSDDGEKWLVEGYHYDRRFLQSLPQIRLTLQKSGNLWKILPT